ncbi:hypothetical protein [Cupriavidus sp. 8B]
MGQAESWLFEGSPNVACFTVRPIVDGRKPLLMVSRDFEDGAWSFLTGEEVQMADVLLVSLRSMAELDPSILDLADLQPGWIAMRRHSGDPWLRAVKEPDCGG